MRSANEERAEKAYRMVIGRYDDRDMDATIADAIADLLHLADQYGGSAEALDRAQLHYEPEAHGNRS